MKPTSDSIREMHQKSAILLWHSGTQLAAEGRLKLLSNIRDQPSQIDREFANIRSSVEWLKKQQDHRAGELLLAYMEILESYLHLRGRDFELVDWCIAGLDACERLKRNPSQVLLFLGNAQYSLGQWEQAGASWQAALTASEGNNQVVYAHTVSALGRLQINQGKYKTALKTLTLAEELLGKINDTQSIISVRSEVAAYHLNRRELDKALRLYLEIDDLCKKNGVEASSDHITLMLGVIYRQKGMFDKANDYLLELCRRGEMQKNISSLATGTHHLAWLHYELGDLEQARSLCGKALTLYEDLKDPRGLSDGYEQLGAILMEAGGLENAINFLKQSIQVRQQIGNDPGSVSSLRRLALAYMLKGDRGLAVRLSVRVLMRYMQLGILSPQRIMALSMDFLAGISRVLFYRVRGSRIKSVMESFSRAFVQPKEQDQTQSRLDS